MKVLNETPTIEELIAEAYENSPWWRKLMPWLPRVWNNKPLRLFTFEWGPDCTRVSKSLTKKHFLDIRITSDSTTKKWYRLEIVGFQVWY